MTNKERKQRGEERTLQSYQCTQHYKDLMSQKKGGVVQRCNPDPPDFMIVWPTGEKVSIEITKFITPQHAVFIRESTEEYKRRLEEGTSTQGILDVGYTSTLRNKPADKTFRENLRNRTLPDDSLCFPNVEADSDIERDFHEVATTVLRQKIKNLENYRTNFTKNILVVLDRLSEFKNDYLTRVPQMRKWIEKNYTKPHFDSIILVDGGHNPSTVVYFNLIQ